MDYQDNLINHLRKNFNIKNNIPKICHSKIIYYLDDLNRKCFVRILSFIDGKMYGDSKINDSIEISLGNLIAET